MTPLKRAFDQLDISIGDCSGEEIRRICSEAIARGEAHLRIKRAARKRFWMQMLAVALATGALSAAALCLCR